MSDALRMIDRISTKLDRIEELISWTVRADQRFAKGQRVQFSAKADHSRISQRRKGGVRTGRVVSTDGFIVTVLLDGYKRPSGYHHIFFDPIRRRASRKVPATRRQR